MNKNNFISIEWARKFKELNNVSVKPEYSHYRPYIYTDKEIYEIIAGKEAAENDLIEINGKHYIELGAFRTTLTDDLPNTLAEKLPAYTLYELLQMLDEDIIIPCCSANVTDFVAEKVYNSIVDLNQVFS